MATIQEFAHEQHMPVETLLKQLAEAGAGTRSAGDLISEQDRVKLRDYLRRSHGEGKTRITLTRKETSEIKATDSQGRARTVQVEVRKKRVLVKRDPAELALAAKAESEAREQEAAAQAAEEEAARQAAAARKETEEAGRAAEEAARSVEKAEKTETAETAETAAKPQPAAEAEAAPTVPVTTPASPETPEETKAGKKTARTASGKAREGRKTDKTSGDAKATGDAAKEATKDAAKPGRKTKTVVKHAFLDESELQTRAEEERRQRELLER
ncbi:MAG: IF-2-associated domain-containing protein, partial [Zoogloeaceae bacterium]|nr:IF-2-associated domain-containing protein [Zoogloeaceae bacterium]